MFGGFGGLFPHALGRGSFEATYRAYPVSFIDKPSAEYADKVFMPPSALDKLASLQIEYPMLFNVENKQTGRSTHCGVLEFIADEGCCYLPYWAPTSPDMLLSHIVCISKHLQTLQSQLLKQGELLTAHSAPPQNKKICVVLPLGLAPLICRCHPLTTQMMQNLLLKEGDLLTIKSVSLPKGTFVKLQPHTTDFLDISNPKAVLEKTLRGFTCLSVGDQVTIHYNNRKYFIDIIEAKPSRAVSVIETDCEVDFAPPLDYVEPDRQQPPVAVPAAAAAAASAAKDGAAAPPEPEAAQPGFVPFAGSGRRLDGRAAALPRATPSAAPAAAGPSTSGAGPAGSPAAAAASRQKQGKVVFAGGNRLAAKQAASKEQAQVPPSPQPEEKPEQPRFKAFQGTGRTLKG